jgi:hypothetical protein
MIPALTTGGSLFTKLEKIKMQIKVMIVKGNLGTVNANQKCQVFCKFKMSVVYGYQLTFFLID